MTPQAQDFLDESRALHALVAPLSDDALQTRTAFKDWTIEDVIGHLHVWNIAADLSLTDPDGFQAFFREVAAGLDGGGLKPFERRWLASLQGRALVAAWEGYLAAMAARFAAADPARRVKWAGPDMSVKSSITARLMETWAHGQEVYDVLGVVRRNEDRLRNIVVLGVNTYAWTFKNRGLEPPGPMPHLRLTAPSGALWTYGDDQLADRIEGLAEEFCQVVTQTRNIADTALAVTGPAATAWMAIAQCFAGAPADPPAPGTRRTAARSSV
jgi:uncharacterized protein (TIGR03084 family)